MIFRWRKHTRVRMHKFLNLSYLISTLLCDIKHRIVENYISELMNSERAGEDKRRNFAKMRKIISFTAHNFRDEVEEGNGNYKYNCFARSFVGAIVAERNPLVRSHGSPARRCSSLRACGEHVKLRNRRPPKPPSDVPTRFSVYTIP